MEEVKRFKILRVIARSGTAKKAGVFRDGGEIKGVPDDPPALRLPGLREARRPVQAYV